MMPLVRSDVDVGGKVDARAMLQQLYLNQCFALLVKSIGTIINRPILNF